MGRVKADWVARLFSYGPKREDGVITGFKMSVIITEGPEASRRVDFDLNDAMIRTLYTRLGEHLAEGNGS